MPADPAYPADGVYHAVYQGVRGSFSEEAARRMLGRLGKDARLLGVPSLEAVRCALQTGLARRAVVPTHNSIAGDVPGADAITRLAGARVEAEFALPIVQCLVAPPGTTLASVRRVLSHPMALAQCRRFLASRPWLRADPHDDTAGALQVLMESASHAVPHAAAIAGERAAKVWGGVILQHGIQDTADNCTTFVLIHLDN
jgi:prephenate dehydratase